MQIIQLVKGRSTMVLDDTYDVGEIIRESEFSREAPKVVTWHSPDGTVITMPIPNTVYPPREDTDLLAEAIFQRATTVEKRFFEVGVGSGVVTALAAQNGWIVSGCDINPLAVSCCKGILTELGLQYESIFEGGPDDDSEEWYGQGSYDLLVWNLPYLAPASLQQPHLGPLEEAGLCDLDDSANGLLKSLQKNPEILAPNGSILLVTNDGKHNRILRSKWLCEGWSSRIINQSRQKDGEVLRIIEFWRPWEKSIFEVVDKIGSTNSHMLEIGGAEGDGIRAIEQFSGRGQRNRNWVSQAGDFTASWIIHECTLDDVSFNSGLIQLKSACAVADACAAMAEIPLPGESDFGINEFAECGLTIKWPNDIWLKGGKLAGILVESRSIGDRIRIVIGIGINRLKRKGNGGLIEAISTLEDLGIAHYSIVKIEAVIAASLASHFQSDKIASHHTEIEVCETVLKSTLIHAETYGQPNLNGVQVTIKSLNAKGELIVELPDGTPRTIDSTDTLQW